VSSGPYTRTSRSFLLDRVVRVDRRTKTYDGVGGTFQQWQTIIVAYGVHLYLDEHQTRIKQEQGEALEDTQFSAVAFPTRNGRTIAIGDRFLDLKNNETYDVVAVNRPRFRHPLNAMWQFRLRKVKDQRPPG
jgi:hypothetical protein